VQQELSNLVVVKAWKPPESSRKVSWSRRPVVETRKTSIVPQWVRVECADHTTLSFFSIKDGINVIGFRPVADLFRNAAFRLHEIPSRSSARLNTPTSPIATSEPTTWATASVLASAAARFRHGLLRLCPLLLVQRSFLFLVVRATAAPRRDVIA
jgi:hypothetical protein